MADKYYIIDKTTNEIKRVSSTPFNTDETKQPPLASDVIQLKEVINPIIPDFDVASEKLMQTQVIDKTAKTLTISQSVEPKTDDEKLAYQKNQQYLAAIAAFKEDFANPKWTNDEKVANLRELMARFVGV